MKPRRSFRPDLGECVLEDRLARVIPNLGLIALTTGGYMLLIPFPGAFVSPSGSAVGPGPTSAQSVSGTPINMPFFMLGSGGISGAIPGNITGVPSLGAGGPASSTGPSVVIHVGSGADEANGPGIPMVSRNTVANDLLNPPPLIGGQPTNTSSLLPPPPAAPAPAPAPPPMSGTAGGPAMPPPGSSLKGPYLRFPSMFPGGFTPGVPAGAQPGTTSSPPTPAPPPPPGYGPIGATAGGVP